VDSPVVKLTDVQSDGKVRKTTFMMVWEVPRPQHNAVNKYERSNTEE